MAAAGRVSFVSKSADATALPNPTRWTQSVEVEDCVRAERLLDQLGMAGWHDDRGMPVPEAIQAWRDPMAACSRAPIPRLESLPSEDRHQTPPGWVSKHGFVHAMECGLRVEDLAELSSGWGAPRRVC